MERSDIETLAELVAKELAPLLQKKEWLSLREAAAEHGKKEALRKLELDNTEAELLSRIKRGERAEKKLDKISEVYKTICLVKVENAPSYQELSIAFLKLCDVIKEQYKEAGNELSITFFID
jgi:hypothetical protein